ncbi:hypothetical protein MNBD_GAMMA18-1129 [hydrothermal vent metagenome]|uniref:Uncharacterized protein n=1 Tax=hydrothermal vent metagenome TaxID=652676 RepID=A0A3B1A3V3_9ZZZZ
MKTHIAQLAKPYLLRSRAQALTGHGLKIILRLSIQGLCPCPDTGRAFATNPLNPQKRWLYYASFCHDAIYHQGFVHLATVGTCCTIGAGQ